MKQDAVKLDSMRRQLEKAKEPQVVHQMEGELDAFERHLKASGLLDEIVPVREMRMRARWHLGRLLAAVQRVKGIKIEKGASASTGFTSILEGLGLNKQTAVLAQRLWRLPPAAMEQAFALAREDETLITYRALITLARPYWYQASRQERHKDIFSKAVSRGVTGPFPLIYADPPWKFHIYSEKGAERTPDQKYPTLSDQQIYDFQIDGVPMSRVAAKDAALLLWCTSSNIPRALWVMEGWGFTFKASAVWVKTKKDGKPWQGMGLVFRNAHELLLYGTRGGMPGPQYQPPSVLNFERGEHSVKPAGIRKLIERMYPDFDASTRLEMFSRDQVNGWTHYGLES